MKNKIIIQTILLCVLVCLVLSPTVKAREAQKTQKPKEEISLKLQQVSGDVYCLDGPGGNMGILKTDEGLLVIDSKYERSIDAVLKELSGLSPKPLKIRYLINTHYHGDHTGGDEALGKYADTIIMHPNCKASLLRGLKEKGAKKAYISKIKPWTEGMVLQPGGETVRLLHFGPGHTVGDLVVVFEKAKVLHTGDLFFNTMPGYIDVKDGSDTGNWVRTIETLCKTYPGYRIIPGHGKIANAGDYLAFADYLKYLRKEVAAAVKAGKTREQAMETINTDQFKEIKENELKDFITVKNDIGWIYDEMTRKK